MGTLINIWLFIDDKKNRGGILNRVHGKESVTGVIKNMDELDLDAIDGAPKTIEATQNTNEGEVDPSDPVEAPHSGA